MTYLGLTNCFQHYHLGNVSMRSLVQQGPLVMLTGHSASAPVKACVLSTTVSHVTPQTASNSLAFHLDFLIGSFMSAACPMQRIVRLGGAVDDDNSNLLVAQLLYLDSIGKKDITMYVNSPGGSVTAGGTHDHCDGHAAFVTA